MSDMSATLIDKILNIQKTHNIKLDNLNAYIKRHTPEIYAEIHELTKNLDKFKTIHKGKLLDISIAERIYCIQHNLVDRPKCAVCGTNYVSRFYVNKNCYSQWCSISCACKDKNTLRKSKNTRKERYGTETYVGADKAKQTRMLRNNGKYCNEDFVDKVRATKLQRYGSETFVNQEKAKKTKVERYGSETFVNQEKARLTKKQRYGDENWNNREKIKQTINAKSEEQKNAIKDQRKVTNIQKYGAEYATQSAKVKDKIANTNIQKYGVKCMLCTKEAQQKRKIAQREKIWSKFMHDKTCIPCFTKEQFLKRAASDNVFRWRCAACGNEFNARYDNGFHLPCDKCYPRTKSGTSKMEQEVKDYLMQISPCKVLWKQPENKQVISHRELDIIIPELKIAIEFNGLYWHSLKNDKTYHLNKTEECEKIGWRLIHIFEDEWIAKKKIVKSRLKHIVSKTARRIFARKCSVALIANEEKDKFLDKYHIQGKDVSSIRYGLIYNGHLVAVMTFTKSRFSKKHQYELSRYATISNFAVVGGASKLLAHFEKDYKPTSLVTYADRRWSCGKLYSELGFTHIHNSRPAYYYVKNGLRHSRMQFQKHKLEKLLGTAFNIELSEKQNMLNAGYQLIYDCGNMVFEKQY